MKKPVKINALSVAKMMSALIKGPCSVSDLIEVSGLSLNTVRGYVRALRSEKLIYVSAGKKCSLGRDIIRVWSLGNKPDAKRTRKTKAQVARECRMRKRLGPFDPLELADHLINCGALA